jgi:hypothetical protein
MGGRKRLVLAMQALVSATLAASLWAATPPLGPQATPTLLGENPSRAFFMLLESMERDWMAPHGNSLETSAQQSPIYVAVSLGFALRGQFLTASRDGSDPARFDRLVREALSFLDRLAAAAKGWDTLQKRRITGAELGEITLASMKGHYDASALERFGRKPSPTPSLLAEVDRPALSPGTPAARPLEPRRTDEDAVVLLDRHPDTVLKRNDPPAEADRMLGQWDNQTGNFWPKATITVSKDAGRYMVSGTTQFGEPIGLVLRYDATVRDRKEGKTYSVRLRLEQILFQGVWKDGAEWRQGGLPAQVASYEFCEPEGGELKFWYTEYGKREALSLPISSGTFLR